MKTRGVAGILLIIIGAVLGLYLGLYVCLFGGIVDVVNAFKADAFPAALFAFGIVKVVCASFVGWITFVACSVAGVAFLK